MKLAGVARRVVHIMSTEQESRVTVIDGHVEMRSPRAATLGRNSEYVATREGAVEVLQLTPEEVAARTTWTQRYFRPRATQETGGVPPGWPAITGDFTGSFDVFRRSARPNSGQRQPEARPQPHPEPQPQADPRPANPRERWSSSISMTPTVR